MSRCFPFPPPGYEKAARSGDNNEDLLKKEKHKEKKHKKEKRRDREKREGKERKDKDGTKDKNKEKNRKEKHKDKTKDKDRDKDKNRTSDDTIAIPPEIHQEDKFGYTCKSDVQDSKFTKELGRSIRDEEQGAADRSVANFTTTTQRRLDTVGISTASEKESGNKMVPGFAGRVQKRNENLTLPQKRTEGMGTGFATKKQKTASGENVSDYSSEPGKNHVAGRPAGNFTGPFQSRTEGTVTYNSLQKERNGSKNLANSLQQGKGAGNNITGREVNNFTGSGQRIEGMLTANSMQKERAGSNNVPRWPVDNFIGFTKENGFTANSMQKEKGASNNLVTNSPREAQRKNDGMGQQSQNLWSSTQRSTRGIGLAPKLEKERVKDSEISMYMERGASNNVVPNLVGVAQRKIEKMGQQVGNLMPSIPRIAEGIVLAPKMEKEVVKDSGMVPNSIGTEQKTNDWMDKSAEKLSEKKKEKCKEKKIKEGKGEEHKDGDRNEKKKSKRKDKDQHKEKEKEEKIREKSEHKRKEHDKLEEIRTKDQVVDITKLIAPPAENSNTTLADKKNKRKEIELNGFLHETDGRLNKLPKTTASSCSIVENGKTLKLNHIPTLSSLELDTVNKTKTERVLGNKETEANGKAEAHPPSVVLRPLIAVVSGHSGKVSSRISSRPDHPDTKYLSTVYSVPEMTEWPEYNDQEWLLLSKNTKPLIKLEDDSTLSEVWAKGLQIESADVFALPYVVPI